MKKYSSLQNSRLMARMAREMAQINIVRHIGKTFCLAAVMLSFAFAAEPASPVVVKAKVSKDKITIGDKVDFDLSITGKGDIKFAPVDLSPYLQAFEIKDHVQKGPYKSWGKTKLSYKLVLTTFTTGNYVIPEIAVKYTDKDGTEKVVNSEKIIIQVEPVKPGPNDKDDIRGLKPPLSVPHSGWFWFFTVILPLLLVAGYLFYRYLQAKKKVDAVLKAEPLRPPHEVAFERLEKLKALKLIEEQKIKEHYFILSEIIRSYLEARFSLPVVERTTSEAYKELLSSGKLKRKEVTVIKDFLEECDLVKFAKVIPDSKAMEEDFDSAKVIVEQTKEILLSPVPEGGIKV